MRLQHLAAGLTAVNAIMLLLLWSGHAAPLAAKTGVEPVVRARALEIVDSQGRIRASITVQPATTVDGKSYPETVLLRLTDPASGPVVKLTAATNGSALTLSDDRDGGVQLFARDTASFVRIVARDGRTTVVRP